MTSPNSNLQRSLTFRRIFVFSALAIALFTPNTSWTKGEYTSDQLKMKNAEEMTTLVNKKIKAAQDLQSKEPDDDDNGINVSSEAVEQLKEAMRLILSRPDTDGSRSGIVGRIRNELQDLNSFDDVLKSLTNEAVAGAKKGTKPEWVVTNITILQNMILEFKPEAGVNKTIKAVLEAIAGADVKISDETQRKYRIKNTGTLKSPSETAREALDKAKK